MLHPSVRSLPGIRLILLLALFLVAPASAAASGLATGATHACAAKTDGTVWCWGSNDSGELGSNGDDESPVPLQVPGITNATAVATGAAHSCALLADRTVKCWGQNVNGQVGSGTGGDTDPVRQSPTTVTGLTDVAAVAAGGFHTCALKTSGSVVCWGWNIAGQLGNNASADFSVTPVAVSALSGATALSAGSLHTCAAVAGGEVRCWGSNSGGQLGIELPGDANASKVPVSVAGASGFTGLSAGAGHTCAINAAKQAVCWGSNGNGQLGDGTKASRSGFAVVPGLAEVRSVAAGGGHTCAALADGSGVKCWGTGTTGELGTGTTTDSLTPVTVVGVSAALEVAAGATFACALLANGSATCWGDGGLGQTGNGFWSGTAASKTPTAVPALTGVTAASTGARTACAVAAGTLKCWGWDGDGNLGSGVAGPAAPSPVAVTIPGLPGGATITDVGVGFGHSCVLTSEKTVYCWGINQSGQLGNGSTADSSGPVQVSGVGGGGVLDDAVQLSVGLFSNCVLREGGEVACWGANDEGQLGDGVEPDSEDGYSDHRSPVAVDDTNFGGPATGVAIGNSHACAVVTGGSVFCWGDGVYGQLGAGNDSSSMPEAVPGVTGASQVGVGFTSSCALVAGGAVRCWGDDSYGDLGDGDVPDASGGDVVTAVPSGAAQLAVGGHHACVVLAAGPGNVSCWGDNSLGQLGNGSIGETPALSPGPVSGLTNAASIDLGFATSCSRLTGGGLTCWGDAYYGQAGDGPDGGHFGLTGLAAPVSGLASIILPPVPKGPPAKIDPPNVDPPNVDPPKIDPPKSNPPVIVEPPVVPTLRLASGKLYLKALLVSPSKKSKCPKRLTVTVSTGKTKQSASVKTKRVKVGKAVKCSLTATIKLKPKKLKKAKRLKVKVSGKGAKTYSKTVKAS